MAGDRLGIPVEPDVEVTRAVTPDLNAAPDADQSLEALALAAAPDTARPVVEAPRRIDVARPDTDDTRLSDMTNNVLAELGFAGVEPVTTNSQAQRQSTSDILAGIEAATGQRSIL